MKNNLINSKNTDERLTKLFRLELLKYQYLIEQCINVTEISIDQNIQINSLLSTYNLQIQTLKKIAATNPHLGAGPDFLLDEILVLERCAETLSAHTETAKTCALGKIGVLFDSLRAASERIQTMASHLPPSYYLHHAKRKLADNDKKIDGLCKKLIEQNIVNKEFLKKIAFSFNPPTTL